MMLKYMNELKLNDTKVMVKEKNIFNIMETKTKINLVF